MKENLQVPFRGYRGQFLETIRILNNGPQHIDWHQQRVDATMKHFYPAHRHSWDLNSCMDIPSEFQEGVVRCRIIYDAHHFSIHYYRYEPRRINSLKLAEAPGGYDYRYKYADRKVLEHLYAQKRDADDILITVDGWITDTSVANIAVQRNGRWYTPSIPLLAGTTWKRLVSSGILTPCPIHVSQLKKIKVLRIFNAMNDWDVSLELDARNID